ncbi:MAG TPA: hypothetical protein VH877_31890 [Polyangia bacterium]|jgi:hypothetical protein|nr:hypothetical protein [Polyangia bacterium]
MRYVFTFALLALIAAPARGLAQPRPIHVYLNDLRLEGGELRGQTLTGVDVRFDDNGDIRILARGYRITADSPGAVPTSVPPSAQPHAQAAPPLAAQTTSSPPAAVAPVPPQAPPPPAAAAPSTPTPASVAPIQGKRYYIAPTPQTRPGAAQYDVEVFVNGMAVRKFRSKDPEPFLEITRWMRPGALNTIRLVAHKEPGPRLSTSSADVFELILGTGELQGGQLLLEPLQRYRRTAAEVNDFNTEMTIDLTP